MSDERVRKIPRMVFKSFQISSYESNADYIHRRDKLSVRIC